MKIEYRRPNSESWNESGHRSIAMRIVEFFGKHHVGKLSHVVLADGILTLHRPTGPTHLYRPVSPDDALAFATEILNYKFTHPRRGKRIEII